MSHPEGFGVEEKGSAFFVVTLLAITSTALVGAYLSGSLGRSRHVDLQIADQEAFNAAESTLNAAIEAVWTLYRETPQDSRLAVMDLLDGKFEEEDRYTLDDVVLRGSTGQAWVRRVLAAGHSHADVEIVAAGWNGRASRRVIAVVRFGRKPSEVFNHAYFINNFGWLWGSGITVNGSVRSNGNFSLRGAEVNGDILASENPELGAEGTIEGDRSHLDLEAYNAEGRERARPTDPCAPTEDANGNGRLDPDEDVNGNGVLDLNEYPGGYGGEPELHPGQSTVEMPYLGDLGTYRALAHAHGGTLTQSGVTRVDAVLGDTPGESESLLLVGTADDPIVIDGPIVVTGDVVLSGVIRGQGTIYAGRNVHILGDLTYLTPPGWEKPLTDRDGAKAANAGADLVGLAAKGSIILGDYTTSSWKSGVSYYQKPPFTQPYVVDESDAGNGYVSWYDDEGRPVYHGDYTAYDGGQKAADSGPGTVARRFFESSFSDAEIHAAAGSASLAQVDAVLYTNHLLSGRIGECTFNGALVSRDEAILYSRSVTMNHDVRIRDDGYEHIDIFLPREPTFRLLFWSEGSP